MNAEAAIRSMTQFPAILSALVEGLSGQAWRRKPDSGKWSILEIVCHLRDEEREDFRLRLQLTVTEPGTPWPPIDPVAAAVERKYNQQDPQTVLDDFLHERRDSLTWLHGRANIDWNITCEHAKLGVFHAGDLLAAWAAHDLLHMRQITRRLYESLAASSHPYKTGYAGDWAES